MPTNCSKSIAPKPQLPRLVGGSDDGKAKPSTTNNSQSSATQIHPVTLIKDSSNYTRSFIQTAFSKHNQSKPPPPQSTPNPISRRPEIPRAVLHKDIGVNSRSVSSSVSESKGISVSSAAAASTGAESSDVVRLVRAQQQQKHNDKNNDTTDTNNALPVQRQHQQQQQQKQQASEEKRIHGSTDFTNSAQKSNNAILDLSRHDRSANGIAAIKVKPPGSNHHESSSSSSFANNAATIQTKIDQKEVVIQSSSRAASSDDQIIEKSSAIAPRPERRHNGAGGDLQNHHEVGSGAPSLGSVDAADSTHVTSPAAQNITTTVPIGDVAVPRNSELNHRENTEMPVMAKNLPSAEVTKNDSYSARMASAQQAILTASVPNKQSSPCVLPNSVFQSTESPSKKSVSMDASDDDDEPLSKLKSSSSSRMKSAEEADSTTIKRLEVTRNTSASSAEGSKSTKPVTRKVPCPLCGQLFTSAGVVKHAATCSLPSSRSRNKGNKRHRNSSSSSKDVSYRKRSKHNKPLSNDAFTSGDDAAARGRDTCSGSQSSEGKVYRTVTQKDLDKADAAIQSAFQLQKNGPKIEWVRETFPPNGSDILPPTEKPYASATDAKNFYSDVLAQCGTARALKVLNIIKMARDGKGNALVLISRMKSVLADKESLVKGFCYKFLPEIDIDRIYRSIPKVTTDEPNLDNRFILSRTMLAAIWTKGGSKGQRREKVVFVRASPPSSGRCEIDLTED
eukprot:CAMPEP_0116004346 /NCGR_PEP_ID=MMETSP0321-20121206/551_1 /TAXON_ID=163516 /ORGANISM="Leptocylindrus danicus var. danicus, Strain B650" /LENGTH=733 /DNA_ID=CAMNT_0003472637 /DNA_START=294 /DNA_END=2496 /DNA_ORIENTATION=-